MQFLKRNWRLFAVLTCAFNLLGVSLHGIANLRDSTESISPIVLGTPARAQFGQFTQGPPAAPAGITVVCHNKASGLSGATTAATNCSGATLIVINASDNSASSGGVSDSLNGAYTNHITCSDTINGCLYWLYAPTVSSSMTFTKTTCVACAIEIIGFSGTSGSTIDQQSTQGVSAGVTTCQPSSITPGHNNEVVVFGVAFINDGGGQTYSVDSGMASNIYQVQMTVATNQGGFISYIVQTAAGAIQPTGTDTATAANVACTSGSFQ